MPNDPEELLPTLKGIECIAILNQAIYTHFKDYVIGWALTALAAFQFREPLLNVFLFLEFDLHLRININFLSRT